MQVAASSKLITSSNKVCLLKQTFQTSTPLQQSSLRGLTLPGISLTRNILNIPWCQGIMAHLKDFWSVPAYTSCQTYALKAHSPTHYAHLINFHRK
eukprot:1150553-Pelagomonas_calceolata.AAC.10